MQIKTEKTIISKELLREREALVSKASAAYTSVFIAKALNAMVWDVDGKEYVDFAGGIGAINVGHCHPRVVSAISEQAGKLIHTSFHVAAYPSYLDVCRELIATIPGAGAKKTIFFNSGSEAIENAVKLAKAFTKRNAVICFSNAFHGRTLFCLALDGKYKPLRQHFGPYPGGVYRAPFPYPYRPPLGISPEKLTDYCLAELENLLRSDTAPEDVAAIVVEPVQGEGGFIVPTQGFLPGLRKICDRHGIVLIIDEVQTGFGRTGRFWAMEHDGVIPDLVAIGKSLAAGLPLSAVAGRTEIMDAAPAGSIGGTYGGNPVSLAASKAVFGIFRDENLIAAAGKIGAAVESRFDSWRDKFPFVGDSRGLGAMRAIELVEDKKTKAPLSAPKVKDILHRCEERGLILIKAGAHDNVLRTLMPLTIEKDILTRGLDILEDVLRETRS
ncbi:MAG: aspartate aminotransferase family protein [Elusimicrobiota bacterium]